MPLIKITNLFIKASFFLIISTQVFADTKEQQLPMYGGTDRYSNPEFIDKDKLFIAKATRTFGTREHASEGYVEHGFEHYSNNKFNKSMQRFNQAWLLNPDNPYVYLGFGLLLNKKEQSCEATTMFKSANEKGLKESGFLADYAYTSAQCALLKEKNEQQELFDVSNDLHNVASQTTNKPLRAYVYHSWARSYFLQNNFSKSKEMIELSKSLSGKIDPALLQSIKKEKTSD
jgi:predicted Zn-dependent protease